MKRIPRFRDLPIAQKLAVTFILTTVTALALATFFYAYTSWQHEKDTAKTELLAVANLIGTNSTAALAFDDATAAQESLSTLRTVPGILHGVLYDKNGEVLARFDRDSTGRDVGDIQGQQVNDAIDYQVSSPVELENDIIGKVVLYASLEPRIQQLLDNVIMVLLASVTSLTIALLVAWRLQKSITNPVSQLAEVMQRVTRNNDYA
ncbi:MAG: CHASE sensor domain-containing protein, partial [Haliea sp.]